MSVQRTSFNCSFEYQTRVEEKKKHSNMTDEVQQHQPQQLDVESGQSLLSSQKDQEKDE